MAAPETRRLAGEHVQLFAERALYWPGGDALLIADLHLGKGDIFRRAGIALPRGGTAADLARISTLLAQTGAMNLYVLGDFLHGAAHEADWRSDWHRWREANAAVAVRVIVGNHDRALASAGLALELIDGALSLGPFQLVHAPGDSAAGHELCGHLHPVLKVPGLPRRWPAFWLRPRQTVLPAFSAFSGGYPLEIAGADAALACIEGHLLALDGPAAQR
jgi:DNA ligase-associated metallophosphoesterase